MNNIEKNNEETVEEISDEMTNKSRENDIELANNEKKIKTEETYLKSKSSEIAGAIDKKESLIALGIKELKKTFFSVTNSSDTNKIKKQIKGQISELDELFEANLGEERSPKIEE